MKAKKSVIFKLLALFICAVMLLPVSFACGEKTPADNAAATTVGDTTPEATTPQPTPPPTTPEPTEPPTTAAPTEPFVPDPNQSYWEQIQSELAWYGFSNGTKIFNGDDEANLMKRLSVNNCKREDLDISKDGVPFTVAYHYYTAKETANFWDAGVSASFVKDIATQPDDMIVGVMWIKGKRTAESDNYVIDDPAKYYLAIKTPTDNWGSEGTIEPSGEQNPQDTWQKVFFVGRVINEEKQSSVMTWNVYMGYGIQEFDIGGVIAYHFPSTPENEQAYLNLMY